MDRKVIDGIREYYDLPASVTDEQIAAEMGGSIGASVVNLRIACEVFRTAMSDSVPAALKKYFGR